MIFRFLCQPTLPCSTRHESLQNHNSRVESLILDPVTLSKRLLNYVEFLIVCHISGNEIVQIVWHYPQLHEKGWLMLTAIIQAAEK